MKLLHSMLMVFFIIVLSGCDLLGEDEEPTTATGDSNIQTAQSDLNTKEQQLETLMTDDEACVSQDCQMAKEEVESARGALEQAVTTGTFTHSITMTEVLSIKEILDSEIIIMWKDEWCEDGELHSDEGTESMEYEISGTTLTLQKDSCAYEVYTGTDSTIEGTWIFKDKVFDSSAGSWCEGERKQFEDKSTGMRESEEITVTSTSITMVRTAEYNCLVDDMGIGMNDEIPFQGLAPQKVSCNQLQGAYLGLTLSIDVSLTNEKLTLVQTFAYKGESCTETEHERFSEETLNCATSSADEAEDDCMENLMKSFCTDNMSACTSMIEDGFGSDSDYDTDMDTHTDTDTHTNTGVDSTNRDPGSDSDFNDDLDFDGLTGVFGSESFGCNTLTMCYTYSGISVQYKETMKELCTMSSGQEVTVCPSNYTECESANQGGISMLISVPPNGFMTCEDLMEDSEDFDQ